MDRFTMKLMISMSNRYANMLNRCAEDNTCVRNKHFFPARSFLKKLLMAFLPAQLRAIYVICVYFDQLPSCGKDVRARSKMAAPGYKTVPKT